MEVCDFTYHRPASLAEASRLGLELGDAARYYAGGTELLIDFRSGRDGATHLISLKNLPELAAIRADIEGLHIGAMTTLTDIAEHPELRKHFPVLREGILTMAGAQIRNQATIGGNFCRAVSCADTPPICIVGGATVSVVGPDGKRTLPAADFFTDVRQTVLKPGELLTEILIPEQPESSGASYQRFSLRSGQALAVASVAARLVITKDKIADARVALGAVAPTPLAAPKCGATLQDQKPTDELFAKAAKAAAAEARPIDDLRGSEAYRRELVEILTRRALASAFDRCNGGGYE